MTKQREQEVRKSLTYRFIREFTAAEHREQAQSHYDRETRFWNIGYAQLAKNERSIKEHHTVAAAVLEGK